ncbi:MAG: hypothetical protein P9F19_13535 [Candidatus Contendobacter sp.]|nr:hypothetical protein [Candidatus Contendobacter sp.]MDG4558393.1 hypothetical protein [Candidatus Contendobacter sp.]
MAAPPQSPETPLKVQAMNESTIVPFDALIERGQSGGLVPVPLAPKAAVVNVLLLLFS